MAISLNIETKIASNKNTSQNYNAMQMDSLSWVVLAARNFQVYAQKGNKLVLDILHGDGAGGSTNLVDQSPCQKNELYRRTSDH